MNAKVHRLRRAAASDAGFTLMEVTVSLALLAIVAAASLTFFVKGTRTVTTQQRQQNAVTVANESMELAFARIPTASASGTSGLVTGRTKAEVDAAWAASAGAVGVADTYSDWDQATLPAPLLGTDDDAVPLTDAVRKSSIDYAVTTLIGTCYRAKNTADGECTKAGGSATGVADGSHLRIMRTIVVVTWPDITGTCGGSCQYSIASLTDPNTDLEWNNTSRLVAADDAKIVNAGDTTSVVIDVLDNDTLLAGAGAPTVGVVAPGPVHSISAAAMGTATVNADRTIKYTPGPDSHGQVIFKYSVTTGARTAQAMVHVNVNPLAVDYDESAVVGAARTVAIKTRYGASPVSIAPVGALPTGWSITGTSVKYTPTAGVGTVSELRYTYADTEGMNSLEGKVKMTVIPAAQASNVTADVPGSSVDYYLNMQTLTSNSSSYRVQVTGAISQAGSTPSGATLKVDGTTLAPANTPLTGFDAKFTPPTKTSGVWKFPFKIMDPLGGLSPGAASTATIKVHPAASPDSVSVPKRSSSSSNTTQLLNLGANDAAYKNTKFKLITNPVSSCGSVTDSSTWSSTGTLTFKAGTTTTSSCYFEYQLEPVDNNLGLTTTTTIRVNVTVTN